MTIRNQMQKFQSLLPEVQAWIEETLEAQQDNAIEISRFSFPRLGKTLPQNLLSNTRFVVVAEKVPFPPLSKMGLPEFKELENMFKKNFPLVPTLLRRNEGEIQHPCQVNVFEKISRFKAFLWEGEYGDRRAITFAPASTCLIARTFTYAPTSYFLCRRAG